MTVTARGRVDVGALVPKGSVYRGVRADLGALDATFVRGRVPVPPVYGRGPDMDADEPVTATEAELVPGPPVVQVQDGSRRIDRVLRRIREVLTIVALAILIGSVLWLYAAVDSMADRLDGVVPAQQTDLGCVGEEPC